MPDNVIPLSAKLAVEGLYEQGRRDGLEFAAKVALQLYYGKTSRRALDGLARVCRTEIAKMDKASK